MTEDKPKQAEKPEAAAPEGVYFNCQRCKKKTPLSDMRVITRFFPMEIVCRDCEKLIR